MSGIIDKPSDINFALEVSRNGHTNNGKLIFQQIFLNVIKFCFLLLLWHALACFGMLWYALACFGMLEEGGPHNTHAPLDTILFPSSAGGFDDILTLLEIQIFQFLYHCRVGRFNGRNIIGERSPHAAGDGACGSAQLLTLAAAARRRRRLRRGQDGHRGQRVRCAPVVAALTRDHAQISPISPAYIPCISPTSPLYLH